MALRLPTAMLALLSLTVVLLLQLPSSDGYSLGAPVSACQSMIPSHGSAQPQASPSPYQITAAGSSVAGGSPIQVRIESGSSQATFKGFFIQARDADTSQIIGTFNSDTFTPVKCGSGGNNAMTHSGASLKTSAVMQWVAPTGFSGDVLFKATVVRDFNSFWTDITSEKVTVTASGTAPAADTTASTADNPPPAAPQPPPSSPATPQESSPSNDGGSTRRRGGGLLSGFRNRAATTEGPVPTAAAPKTTPPSRVSLEELDTETRRLVTALDSIYLGCNVNKGCFGMPVGCEVDSKCDSLFTYTRTGATYLFEIMGSVPPGVSDYYIAGGLSYDTAMGTDSVVACRVYNAEMDLTMTLNKGYTNVFLQDQKLGLSDINMKQVDGKLYCVYNRAAVTVIESNTFDLNNGTFHLMIAKGSLAADGTLLYHDTNKQVSASATSMSEFESLGVSGDLFIVLHACFMVAAWVGAASSGILLARYYKQTWKNYKVCNIDQWFHFHRLFMILTWSLTIAAFVLVAIHLNGWTKIPGSQNPHAYIGIVSIGLCFIQPFMALFRCKPTDSRRPVFNWLHWFVGNAAQILGIIAIFFGFELYGLPHWTWGIMVFYVVFHVLMHIILSIGECCSSRKGKTQIHGVQMKDFNSSRDPLNPGQPQVEDAPGGTFRKAMLGLYLLVVWLVVAAIIAVIVVDEEDLDEAGVLFWQ